MFLNEIAEIMKLDVLDAAIEIIKEGDPSIASFMINENDLHVFATQKWTMTGSDGSEGHPRKYATYPKVFQDMVLKERLFSLEKFIYRSSGLVADTFNLCDRGYLEEGRKADIIILDLERFTPLANFEDPTLLSTGVIHAMVNGKQVITREHLTEELPGVVINRQKINCEVNEIQ
jgi:N-acyl-D-aspartate/D-glutamate deacylase